MYNGVVLTIFWLYSPGVYLKNYTAAIRNLSISNNEPNLYYGMTNIRSLLSTNIKKRRAFLGLSQADLAERVKTSTHYLAQIEQMNKFPSSDMLERLAAALEFDTPDLFSLGPYTDEAIQQFKKSIAEDIAAVSTNINATFNQRLDTLFTSRSDKP